MEDQGGMATTQDKQERTDTCETRALLSLKATEKGHSALMHIHVPEGTCVCVFHVQWAMLCEEWSINNKPGEEAILSNTRSP